MYAELMIKAHSVSKIQLHLFSLNPKSQAIEVTWSRVHPGNKSHKIQTEFIPRLYWAPNHMTTTPTLSLEPTRSSVLYSWRHSQLHTQISWWNFLLPIQTSWQAIIFVNRDTDNQIQQKNNAQLKFRRIPLCLKDT